MERTRLVKVCAVVAIALAAPIALSSKTAVAIADCGAQSVDGRCCKETGSICNDGKKDVMDACWSTGECKTGSALRVPPRLPPK